MSGKGGNARRWGSGLLACWLVFGVSCAAQPDDHRHALVVMAASSLQDVFRELEKSFESIHPDVDVELIFAGSQVLRLQIEEGARVDVFVSANRKHIDELVSAGRVTEAKALASGALALIVSSSGQQIVEQFEDVVHVNRIVLGAPGVPIGAYTDELLRKIKSRYGPNFFQTLQEKVVSRESNVRLVRAKILLDEADAAVVYRSDALADGRIRTVPIPPELNVKTTHWYAKTIRGTPHPAREQFLRFLSSDVGKPVFARHGFEALP